MNFTSLLPEAVALESSLSLKVLMLLLHRRRGSEQGFVPVPLSHPLSSSLLSQRGDAGHSPAPAPAPSLSCEHTGEAHEEEFASENKLSLCPDPPAIPN